MQTCPSCNQSVPAGVRWCPLCYANVIDPRIGRLASPGKRFGAYVFDTLIPLLVLWSALCGGGAIGAAVTSGDAEGTSNGGGGLMLLVMVAIFLAYGIWALVLFANGTTPGKYLLGMYVVKESGARAGFWTMLFREWIGKAISGLVFGIGYLWIFLDKERQAWHDKIASTYVAEKTTS